MKKQKEKFTDDGRVIAPMNVEGMPWYNPKKTENGDSPHFPHSDEAPAPLTRSETIAFTWGVLKAVLLVGLIYIGGLFAFIMFCIHVWFK